MRGKYIVCGIAVGAAILAGATKLRADSVELVDAPRPQPVKTMETHAEHAGRIMVLSAVVAARFEDWRTTKRCNQLSGCHEAELPQAVAGSPWAMAGFEVGWAGAEILVSNKVAKRHPKIAFWGDVISGAAIWSTVGRNYAIQAGRPVATPGMHRLGFNHNQ
jgi:hypothetical protein